jgi:hypothetical protein
MTDAREARAAELRARRGREHACALDFLVYGDAEDREPHATRCIHPDPCSRNYDPMPYPEAMPMGRLYEGTGIGALYELGMETESGRSFAPDLAGWNLMPRSTR